MPASDRDPDDKDQTHPVIDNYVWIMRTTGFTLTPD